MKRNNKWSWRIPLSHICLCCCCCFCVWSLMQSSAVDYKFGNKAPWTLTWANLVTAVKTYSLLFCVCAFDHFLARHMVFPAVGWLSFMARVMVGEIVPAFLPAPAALLATGKPKHKATFKAGVRGVADEAPFKGVCPSAGTIWRM